MQRPAHSPKTAATLAVAAFACAASAAPASADGYVMGAGRWTCAQMIDAVGSGNASAIGQAAGWVLGYWSAATFRRESGFVDIVEQVGGQAIYDKTVEECRKAPPETLLYTVANAMISNTK